MHKFNYPKTKFQDYIDMRKMVATNYFILKNGSIQESEIKENVNFIYERFFASKIFEDDFYKFTNLTSLEVFLLNTKYFSKEKVRECISHEKEHIKEACRLRYNIEDFYVMLLDNNSEPSFAAGGRIDKNKINFKDFRKIVLAPKNLSLTDKLFK